MKKYLCLTLFCIVFLSCKKASVKTDTKNNIKKNSQVDLQAFTNKLSFQYLVNSNVYKLDIKDFNNKVLRVGKESDQSLFFRLNKRTNYFELNVYNEVEWLFGGIIKDHEELKNGLILHLYDLNNIEKFLFDLLITKAISDDNILKIKLPKEYFTNENNLEKYFISKVELDSIMIKNSDYMNPLDDDSRQYVPYYFKINKNFNKNVFYVSSNNGLNLREKPILSSKVLRKLNYKEPIFVNDTISKLITINNTDGYWVKIEDVVGNKGFVFNAYLIK